MKKYWIVLIIVLILVAGFLIWWRLSKNKKQTTVPSITASVNPSFSAVPILSESPLVSPTPSQTPVAKYAEPVAEFKSRITKKSFGIYIDPATSPVQPERFSGYHNAVDVEYQDVTEDVPVYALADGTIVYSDIVSGYGGMFMIEFDIDGVKHKALYGHIRPSSLPGLGQTFSKGQQIAVLGTGYSTETDGERRHLHFSILSDNRIDMRGYVQNESELSGWVDPLNLYK